MTVMTVRVLFLEMEPKISCQVSRSKSTFKLFIAEGYYGFNTRGSFGGNIARDSTKNDQDNGSGCSSSHIDIGVFDKKFFQLHPYTFKNKNTKNQPEITG